MEKDVAKDVMTEELAFGEFARWAEAHEVETTDNDAGKIAVVTKAIRRGLLVLGDDGEFVYTVSARSPEGCAGEQLRLVEPNARAYMAMDGYKDTDQIHKAMAMAGVVTGRATRWFSDLSGQDWKVVSVVLSFLL